MQWCIGHCQPTVTNTLLQQLTLTLTQTITLTPLPNFTTFAQKIYLLQLKINIVQMTSSFKDYVLNVDNDC